MVLDAFEDFCEEYILLCNVIRNLDGYSQEAEFLPLGLTAEPDILKKCEEHAHKFIMEYNFFLPKEGEIVSYNPYDGKLTLEDCVKYFDRYTSDLIRTQNFKKMIASKGHVVSMKLTPMYDNKKPVPLIGYSLLFSNVPISFKLEVQRTKLIFPVASDYYLLCSFYFHDFALKLFRDSCEDSRYDIPEYLFNDEQEMDEYHLREYVRHHYRQDFRKLACDYIQKALKYINIYIEARTSRKVDSSALIKSKKLKRIIDSSNGGRKGERNRRFERENIVKLVKNLDVKKRKMPEEIIAIISAEMMKSPEVYKIYTNKMTSESLYNKICNWYDVKKHPEINDAVDSLLKDE